MDSPSLCKEWHLPRTWGDCIWRLPIIVLSPCFTVVETEAWWDKKMCPKVHRQNQQSGREESHIPLDVFYSLETLLNSTPESCGVELGYSVATLLLLTFLAQRPGFRGDGNP